MAKNVSEEEGYKAVNDGSNLEIIKLGTSDLCGLAINKKSTYVCKYVEGEGLIIQEKIAEGLQKQSNDYCLPVLTPDKFFTPKKAVDYHFFNTNKLEERIKFIKNKKFSTNTRGNIKQTKKLTDLELLLSKKKAIKSLYLKLREGKGLVCDLVKDLKLKETIVKSYLLILERQGFVKEDEGFYCVYPEKDFVLNIIYKWEHSP